MNLDNIPAYGLLKIGKFFASSTFCELLAAALRRGEAKRYRDFLVFFRISADLNLVLGVPG